MTVLSQQAVAKKISKSTRTVRRWTKEGIIPHRKGYGGRPYYIGEQIDRWLESDR